MSSYPSTKNRFMENYDSISASGPAYLFMPAMLIFGLLVTELTREK